MSKITLDILGKIWYNSKMELLIPDIVMSGKSFNDLPKCCVYQWMRGNEWLYVGSTKHGFGRVMQHHVLGILEPVQDNDSFIITNFPDPKSAYDYEQCLIKEKQPKYNGFRKRRSVKQKNKSKKSAVIFMSKPKPLSTFITEAKLPDFKMCLFCHEAYKPEKPWQKFCSPCKSRWQKHQKTVLKRPHKAPQRSQATAGAISAVQNA